MCGWLKAVCGERNIRVNHYRFTQSDKFRPTCLIRRQNLFRRVQIAHANQRQTPCNALMNLLNAGFTLPTSQYKGIRVNCSYAWSQEIEQALGVLVRALAK